ncbi:MAG TPA: hypothetical protein IAB35_02105 [Candidatus Faecimonas gallistercoris]|nr:hypothetical protein [Candidatus Faecimonas gallistercoris]
MSIKQSNIGSIVTHDDYKKYITEEILAKKDEFKQRGCKVVKENFIDNWEILVDNSLADLDQVWYNGASIEATLQCMEKLSQGFPIEEAYIPIDIQNPDVPCVHFGMELSGWQNHSITSVVGTYHERGQEFCDYRNSFVNNQTNSKRRYLY